ncbi:MAG TPA: tetratricopeptide repeat protein [Stellaceae bacterium]|nr:tetratricopeptide repeat protein [Stellaceae bacterium]
MNSAGSAVTDLFGRGLLDHRADRLQQAQTAYRRLLTSCPAHADALHLLGIIALQMGRNDLAIDYIRQAIALHGTRPDGYSNLGAALRNFGLVRPDLSDSHNNLGNVLYALGRPAEAEASCREALRLRPDYPEAHINLGNALHALGRPAEAEASHREALRLRPENPEAHNNLGIVLYALGRPAQAEANYREALRLRPNYPEAHINLGIALHALGRSAEAEASCREALRLRPDSPEAHINLGYALHALGRPAEAEANYREALRLRPNCPEAHNNLGTALNALGRPAEAEASCREALRLQPESPEAHFTLGYALLLAGRFEEGWKEYEWRWKTKQLSGRARAFSAPLWNGETIGDRIILLHAEQGFGDTLQFCRYVPLIACGARIILEVQAPLVRLLSRLPGIMEIVPHGDGLPRFDLHCPLLSLPRAFGTTLDTIPAATPYLSADPALAANWHERLAGLDGLRIGLVWAGSQRLNRPEEAAFDRRRSIALDAMAPLSEVSGVSFVSLQKYELAAQATHPLHGPPHGMTLHDFTADLHDFEDTAALIVNLDLVISVDTSVAHLAGALGKPVWLLNRFDTCWRWLLNRDDSLWYPTLRQFRQPCPGDWNSVICEVRDALQHLAAGEWR